AFAVVGERRMTRQSLPYRRPRLFDLQEEVIVLIAAEQGDEAARPHRADAHYLVRRVNDLEAIEQDLMIPRQRPAIGPEKGLHVAFHVQLRRIGVKEERRLIGEARLA